MDWTDTFVRADSTATLNPPSDGGPVWVAIAGTWGINSNTAYTAVSAVENVAVRDGGEADGMLEITLATYASEAGAAIRVVDASNFIDLAIGSGGATLYTVVAGSYNPVPGGSHSHTPGDGDVYQLVFSGATISLKRNGATLFAVAGVTAHQTATRHGMRTYGSTTVRFGAVSFMGVGGAFGGALTADSATLSGSFTTAPPSSFSGGLAADSATLSGSFGSTLGTLALSPLMRLASGTVPVYAPAGALTWLNVRLLADGSQVAHYTDKAVGASGVVAPLSSALFMPGFDYFVTWLEATGAFGHAVVRAA